MAWWERDREVDWSSIYGPARIVPQGDPDRPTKSQRIDKLGSPARPHRHNRHGGGRMGHKGNPVRPGE